MANGFNNIEHANFMETAEKCMLLERELMIMFISSRDVEREE